MADLGTLGGTDSWGYAINDSGQVAGRSQTTGNADFHAFLCTGTPEVDGQMIDLDTWLDANNPTEGAKWTPSSLVGDQHAIGKQCDVVTFAMLTNS